MDSTVRFRGSQKSTAGGCEIKEVGIGEGQGESEGQETLAESRSEFWLEVAEDGLR